MARCFETVCKIIIASKGVVYRPEKEEIETKSVLTTWKYPNLKKSAKQLSTWTLWRTLSFEKNKKRLFCYLVEGNKWKSLKQFREHVWKDDKEEEGKREKMPLLAQTLKQSSATEVSRLLFFFPAFV